MQFVENPGRRLIRRSSVSLIAILVGASLLAPASSLAAPDNRCYKWNDQEELLADKLNRARSSEGVKTLKLDPELSKYASRMSARMAKKHQVLHSTEAQFRDALTNFTILGEAVVSGNTVGVLHRRIIKQPQHRFLALHESMSYMGVGVTVTKNSKYAAVLFSGGGNPGTRLDMPKC